MNELLIRRLNNIVAIKNQHDWINRSFRRCSIGNIGLKIGVIPAGTMFTRAVMDKMIEGYR